MGEESRSLIEIILILSSATLYALGLMGGKKGRYLFLIGFLVHSISIVFRGLTIGGVPLTEKRDNISFMAFATALSYIWFGRKVDIVVIPIISLLLVISLSYPALNTISPFMHSPWFYLHMFFYLLSYGLFAVSSSMGLYYVFNKGDYDGPQYEASLYGWVGLTLSLLFGSIWFFMAYGTYWLWTSRELWSTILWFYYALYLHLRLIKGLRGRFSSVIGVMGYGVAIFTYFGVGTIIPSPPTQF